MERTEARWLNSFAGGKSCCSGIRRAPGYWIVKEAHRPMGLALLQVCFQEPEVLVGCARDLGEDVGSAFVTEAVGGIDGLAGFVGNIGQSRRKRFQVLFAADRLEIVFLQACSRGDLARRS